MTAHDLIRKFIHVTPRSLQTNFLVAKFKQELGQYMGGLASYAYLDIDDEIFESLPKGVDTFAAKQVLRERIEESQQTVMQFLKDKIEGTTISDCDTVEAMF